MWYIYQYWTRHRISNLILYYIVIPKLSSRWAHRGNNKVLVHLGYESAPLDSIASGAQWECIRRVSKILHDFDTFFLFLPVELLSLPIFLYTQHCVPANWEYYFYKPTKYLEDYPKSRMTWINGGRNSGNSRKGLEEVEKEIWYIKKFMLSLPKLLKWRVIKAN